MKPCREYDEMWVAYLDEELAPDLRARMAAHLQACDACAAELAGLDRALAAVDDLEATSPSEAFGRSFWERFEGEGLRSAPPWWRRFFQPRWVLLWGSGLAASVMVVFLLARPEPLPVRTDPAEALIASHLDLFTDFETIRQLDLLADLDVIAQLDEE